MICEDNHFNEGDDDVLEENEDAGKEQNRIEPSTPDASISIMQHVGVGVGDPNIDEPIGAASIY